MFLAEVVHLLAVLLLALSTQVVEGAVGGAAAQSPAAVASAIDEAAQREQALVQAANDNARLAAALDLVLAGDFAFLRARLEDPALADPLVLAILSALRIRAADSAGVLELVPVTLALTGDPARAEVCDGARSALVSMYEAHPQAVRPHLIEALGRNDATAIAACRALGEQKELEDVVPLLECLERPGNSDALASALVAALDAIIPLGLGVDAVAWRLGIDELLPLRRRDRILDELIARGRARETALHESLVDKDQLLLKVKIAADENSLDALLGDLVFPVPAVRRFAAETLRRRMDTWDVTTARATLIERLEGAEEAPEVVVAFLALLVGIDRQSEPVVPDPRRDAILVASVASRDASVVTAAALAVQQIPTSTLDAAVLRAVSRLSERPWNEKARTELVRACGALRLRDAKDALVYALRSKEESVDVRVAAVNAVGEIRLAEARDDLAYALERDPDWQVRRRAASALMKVDETFAVPRLIQQIDDPRPEVRIDIVTTIARSSAPEVTAALIRRLGVETEIKPAIIKALGSVGTKDAVPAICAAVVAASVGDGVAGVAEDAWREARDALMAIVGDDLAAWERVASALAARPAMAAWAIGQKVRLLKVRGDGALVLRAQLDQARAATAGRQWEMVSQTVEAALATDGDDPIRVELRMLLADAYVHQSKADQALAVYERLAGAPEPTLSHVRREKGRLLLERGELAKARAELSAIADPQYDDVLLLARIDRREQQPAEAARRLRKLLGSGRLTHPGQLALIGVEAAECLLECDDLDGARALLDPLPRPADDDLARRYDLLQERLNGSHEVDGAGGGRPAEERRAP